MAITLAKGTSFFFIVLGMQSLESTTAEPSPQGSRLIAGLLQAITFRYPYQPDGSVSKPCTPGEHKNSWDLWMFIPLKMVLIGIDPYPNILYH